MQHSLLAIRRGRAGTEQRTVFAAAASRDPARVAAELARVAESPRIAQPSDVAARPSSAERAVDGGPLSAIAAMHEPTDWATALCGLVVVAFIARRKANWTAN